MSKRRRRNRQPAPASDSGSPPRKSGWRIGVVLVAIALALLGAEMGALWRSRMQHEASLETLSAQRAMPEQSRPASEPDPASRVSHSRPELQNVAYVGNDACGRCHQAQLGLWRSSQHAVAMQAATDITVAGDFRAGHFRYGKTDSKFFKRDGRFFVRTDGTNGRLGDYEIAYTFGVDPLQQYLIPFPDGRMQALSIAWDTRPATQGGQRWFHLYPDASVDHRDAVHWTRPSQNWNFMCGECHVTGFDKNYDAATNRFATRWNSLGVGCEACHGPASAHIAWADAHAHGANTDVANKGLVARLDERAGIAWTRDAAHDTARRSSPRAEEREIEVCAQCHARRAPIAAGYVAGKRFLDYYLPALLMAGVHHADGQQLAEVYNWGSFLQSRMYAAGVTCSDCHEPHAAKLRARGNALCTQCHQASRFDSDAHHHHASGSAGSQCVSCHMPTTTFMQVDPRHDHGLRVPRPDLSVTLGTPNACNDCHRNRDARWALERARSWWGDEADGLHRYAAAFAAADQRKPGAGAALRKVASDGSQPAIARASAIARIDPNRSAANLDAIATATHDADPLVRLGALEALAQAPAGAPLRYAGGLLSDAYRAIRIEAANVVAGDLRGATDSERRAFESAATEFVAAQRYNADRADARTRLGSFELRRGNFDQGVRELEGAIALDPAFAGAYVELADAYRSSGRDARAEETLRNGLKQVPRDATLHHALGLALVSAKRGNEALVELAEAMRLAPANAHFAYVYAVAQNSLGQKKAALATLDTAAGAHPNDREILEALVSLHRDAGDTAEAKRYADELRKVTTEEQQ